MTHGDETDSQPIKDHYTTDEMQRLLRAQEEMLKGKKPLPGSSGTSHHGDIGPEKGNDVMQAMEETKTILLRSAFSLPNFLAILGLFIAATGIIITVVQIKTGAIETKLDANLDKLDTQMEEWRKTDAIQIEEMRRSNTAMERRMDDLIDKTELMTRLRQLETENKLLSK